jgi:hypothetical protein
MRFEVFFYLDERKGPLSFHLYRVAEGSGFVSVLAFVW